MNRKAVSVFACVVFLASSVWAESPDESLIDNQIQITEDGAFLVPTSRIRTIEVRNSGFHAVFLKNRGLPRDFPDLNCDLIDRGVIKQDGKPAEAMLDTALIALSNDRRIRLKVRGCAYIDGHESLTAPRIVKVQLF